MKTKKKKRILHFCVLILALCLVMVGKEDEDILAAKTPKLNKKTVTLEPGKKAMISLKKKISKAIA